MDEHYEAMKLLELSQRIDKMRNMYKTQSHYEKVFLKQEAEKLKKGLNRSIGQFKRKLKTKYYFNDFLLLVIDNVF